MTAPPPGTAEGRLEVDDSIGSDSAYGDDDERLTASITSSVLAFREENGRRYHAYKDGKERFSTDNSRTGS